MGMFLNPDDQQLRDDRCQPFYVDKSLIISEMNNIIRQKSDKFGSSGFLLFNSFTR